MSITTRISLQTSLRWLRRALAMTLILSNFAATMLADVAWDNRRMSDLSAVY